MPTVNRKGPEAKHTQSVIFHKAAGWTEATSRAWCRSHDYRTDGLDETDALYRWRQYDPDPEAFEYRNTTIDSTSDGEASIVIVYGIPKAEATSKATIGSDALAAVGAAGPSRINEGGIWSIDDDEDLDITDASVEVIRLEDLDESTRKRVVEKGCADGVPIAKGIRPLFGSPGGKKLLAKRLIALFPEHSTYVEPFVGGGAVFYGKPPSEREIIGDLDLDPDIAHAYSFVKRITDPEIEALKRKPLKADRAIFKKVLASAPTGDVDRLYKFLYLVRFSMMASRSSPNPGRIEAGDDLGSTISRIPKARERLKDVIFRGGDYRETIVKFDGDDTLHYLDPPYEGTAWTTTEMLPLADFVESIKGLKGKIVASYHGSPEAIKAFEDAGYDVHVVGVFRSTNLIGGRATKAGGASRTSEGDDGHLAREIIITNFATKRRGDLVSLKPGDPSYLAHANSTNPHKAAFYETALKAIPSRKGSNGVVVELFAGSGGSAVARIPGEHVAVEVDKTLAHTYEARHPTAKVFAGPWSEALSGDTAAIPEGADLTVADLDASGSPFEALDALLDKASPAGPVLATLTWGYLRRSIMEGTTRPKAWEAMKAEVGAIAKRHGLAAKPLGWSFALSTRDKPRSNHTIYGAFSIAPAAKDHLASPFPSVDDPFTGGAPTAQVTKITIAPVDLAAIPADDFADIAKALGEARITKRIVLTEAQLASAIRSGAVIVEKVDPEPVRDGWLVSGEDDVTVEDPSTPTPSGAEVEGLAKSREIPILKADEERRIIYGPVLIPDEVDAQGDVITADAIEKAAHDYLERYNLSSRTGYMHRVFSKDLRVVESFIAPQDLTFGDRVMPKGTWILGMHVVDDDAWKRVRSGEIRGFSIGGVAKEARAIDGGTE